MEGRNYETVLPEGYREEKVVDATSKKFGIMLNAAAILLMIVIGAVLLWVRGNVSITMGFGTFLLEELGLILAIAAVLTVHELLHGLAYKVLTKHKLSFGLTWSAAYCGVPDIYVYRPTALIALLTPFTIFTLLFLAGLLFAPVASTVWDFCAVLFAIHTGGCVGDLYDTWLYAVHFRKNSTLMRDTGPKQTFYLKQKRHREAV